MVVIYNASQIYDGKLTSILTFIGEILSLITIIFSFILLLVVIKKTPKHMARFKFYMIQYVCFALIFEFVLLLCPFTILHPLHFTSPNGIAKYVSPNITLIICLIGAFSAFSLLDCSIGIIFERYYALSATSNSKSKKALYIYKFLMAMNFLSFIFGNLILFFKPNLFFVSPNEIYSYLNQFVVGLEADLQVETLMIFQKTTENSIPIEIIGAFGYGLLRVIIALFGLYLNMKQSRNSHLSINSQKANELFQRIIYIQFFGYIFLIGFPISIITFCFYFIREPSNIPNICLRILTAYGMYDTVFTALFIKPYREAIFYPLKFLKKESHSKISVINIEIKLTQISRIR